MVVDGLRRAIRGLKEEDEFALEADEEFSGRDVRGIAEERDGMIINEPRRAMPTYSTIRFNKLLGQTPLALLTFPFSRFASFSWNQPMTLAWPLAYGVQATLAMSGA